MKLLMVMTVALLSTLTLAGTAMKLEGSCTGTQSDGTPVAFNYYSDYDGCKAKSQASILFTAGREGLNTGVRTFPKNKDMYLFNGKYRLNLYDSTGNTTATFHYTNDETGKRETVNLQCDIRDYEYVDC